MAQPIWLSGCPTSAQKRAKNAFMPTINMSTTVQDNVRGGAGSVVKRTERETDNLESKS